MNMASSVMKAFCHESANSSSVCKDLGAIGLPSNALMAPAREWSCTAECGRMNGNSMESGDA